MKNIFIFHGTGGHSEENWFPWLKAELEKKGYSVFIPDFPTPKNQSLNSWLEVLNNYIEKINKDSILIGHSLGAAFLLRVLENLNIKIKQAILVAAPIGVQPIGFYEADKKFLGSFDFDWKKILSSSNSFSVFHSEDDPNVCYENGIKLASNLNTGLITISNSGHFNQKAGYTKFEKLLEIIK